MSMTDLWQPSMLMPPKTASVLNKLPAFTAVHLEKSKIFLEAKQLSYRIKMLFYEEEYCPGKIFGVFIYRAEDT